MLCVTLLGEQLVADADGTVRTRSPRTVALLAFLVVHSRSPRTRQRIAGVFWPDSTDEQALTNLRRELHHLRGVLDGDSSLVVTSRDLGWRDVSSCQVDVRAFETDRAAALAAATAGDNDSFLRHATAAVERYRGEFLPDSYADWALRARAELEQQCVDLFDRIAAVLAGTGDPGSAVRAARRRVQLRPLEEVGYRTLMGLQGDLGDRSGAVSTYHHCASVLERELGVEPDPLTRVALNRLLARAEPAVASAPGPGAGPGAGPGPGPEPGPGPGPRPGPGPGPGPGSGSGSGPGPAPAPRACSARAGLAGARFVGRAREFGVLHEQWQAAAQGRPGFALVRGKAGVGKSRLMAELAEVARRGGAAVAGAQCFGTSGRLALAPVADWLRTPAIRSALTGLDRVWRVEVERLVPSAKTRAEPGPGPRAMVDAWQRHRFFEGITRALVKVGRPVLLTVDNLHRCDQETLAFITFGLALVTDAPLMVAATMRDEQSDEPGLAPWIVRMRATGLLTEVALDPFEVADTAALAEAITGRPLSAADADLVQATTGGFPLYVVEAARTRAGSGPLPAGELSQVLVNRLGQVSAVARDVSGLAAAVGRDFTLDLLCEATDLDADAVVRAVDELWRSRILREVDDGYDFSHDLLRDAAYAQVSRPQRWLLHRRIARGLELLHAEDTDVVSAQLAEQYVRAGRGERAVGYYQRAAAVAADMFAHSEAIRLHEAALSIVRGLPAGRDRDRHELAVLEAMAAPLNARFGYASPKLRQTLDRSIVLAESLGRRDAMLGSLVGLWSSEFVHGDTRAAHRTASRALDLVQPDSPLSGPAHFAFGGSAVSLGQPEAALRHFALAGRYGGTHALSVGTRPDVHGQAFAAHAHWLLGHADEALACCAGAIALARTIDNSYSLTVALAYGAITHQLRQDLPELCRTVAELRELCDRYSYAYYREWVLILDGWTRTDGSGGDLARRGIDALTSANAFARMPYWLSLSADLAAREDRPDAARATLDAALAGGRARDDSWWLPEVLRMRAAYDSAEQAATRLCEAARLAAEHGSVALLARCEADLAALGVPSRQAFGVPTPS